MESVRRSNLFFLIVLIVMIGGSSVLGSLGLSPMTITLLTEYLFLLVPVLIYLRLTKQPIKERMRFNKISFKDVILIIIISLSSMPILGFLNTITSKFFQNHFAASVSTFPSMPLIGWIFVLGITPAICEEAVLRGVVLGGYKNIDIKKAALMNGFLFGIFHLNINQFSYAFVLGIIMAYLVYITNSIFSSILMHFTINGISAIANWSLSKSGGDLMTIANNVSQSNLQSILTGLVLAILFSIIVIMLIKRLFKIHNKNIEMYEDTNRQEHKENNSSPNKERIFTLSIVVSTLIFVGFSLLLWSAQSL